MFSEFEHDPPDDDNSDDIMLFAGPKERQALIEVLDQETDIIDIKEFINELTEAIQTQISLTSIINKDLGFEYFLENDNLIAVSQHLSDMSQDDVDKVRRHFQALFIERDEYYVDVTELDQYLDKDTKEHIFNNIILPWIDWVRSFGQEESDSTISDEENNKSDSTISDEENNKSDSTISDEENNKSNIVEYNTDISVNNNTTKMNNNTTKMNNNTTTINMFESLTSVFANMLGTLEPNMIRMTFDGKVAVKTNKGYKTYDVVKKKAVNMDSLVMPDMPAFLLLPSTKVKVGDIILRDNAFYSIISIDDATNELVGYNYESGKKETLVRETHCFLGNTYFYSKLVSPLLSFFGNKPKSDAKKEEGAADAEVSEDITFALFPLAMMSQNNGDMNSILPLMLMSKMEGKEESSGMMKMLMLSGMMGGENSNMNNLLPFMMMSGNFPSI